METMIEIVAEGPAHRVDEGEKELDDVDGTHREIAVTQATYVVERIIEEPVDLTPYLTGRADEIVQELVGDPAVGDWQLDVEAGPGTWNVQVAAEPEAWADAAAEVAADRGWPEAAAIDVLTEWIDAPRDAIGATTGLQDLLAELPGDDPDEEADETAEELEEELEA